MIGLHALIAGLRNVGESFAAFCQTAFLPDPDVFRTDIDLDQSENSHEGDDWRGEEYLALVPWWM
jgi:hypothetical protein